MMPHWNWVRSGRGGGLAPSRAGAPFFILFLGLGCGSQPDSPGPSNDTADLEALVGEWVGMWNSYDLDQVSRLFLHDSRLTYFSSEREGVIQGMEALLDHHRGFGFVPGGEEKGTRLWVDGLRVDLLDDAAVLTGIWYFETNPGSTEDPQQGPVTIVCHRTGEGWRFVHMNFSEYLPSDSIPIP